MGFLSRLLGRQEPSLSASTKAVPQAAKRQQPSSPASGSFASDCFGSRPAPAVPVKIQNVSQIEAEPDSDDEETIHVPRPMSIPDRGRGSSNGRRRAAIDISPTAVQRLAEKVATLEEHHYRTSLDGDDDSGVTRMEIEQLYTDLQLIHRGRSSMIYRAREVRTGQRVILKAYDAARLTPTKRQNLDRQIRALKAAVSLLGPQGGAVALERVVENSTGVYLVLQACNGGTLIEAIANSGGKLPERQVAMKVALPMLKALSRLHKRGIVHRDIKPEHLMIHNGNLKLGDFGNAGCIWGTAPATPMSVSHDVYQHSNRQQHSPCVAAYDGHTQHQLSSINGNSPDAAFGQHHQTSTPQIRDAMNFRTGSIEYMAPEMLGKPTSAEVFHLVISQGIDEDELPAYDQKVDVWSLGVVLYEALTGLQPFLADTAAEMAAVIDAKLSQTAAGQHQHWPAFINRLPVTNDCKDFILACLHTDPKQRPAAEQLLQHPWLQIMQEQAAAVAASRAASRRVSRSSFSVSCTTASAAAAAAANAAAAAAAAAAAFTAAKEPYGAVLVTADSSGPLVDPLVRSALISVPLPNIDTQPKSSLDLSPEELSRSQTDINLEVGVRTVYRTSTQRMEAKPSSAHVHGPT